MLGLNREVERRKGRAAFEREEAALAAADRLSDLRRDLDLSPATLHRTLEIALGMGFGQPRLHGPDARGRLQLRQPLPPRWVSLIDEHLRLPGRSGEQGALPSLIFDAQLFLSKAGERPVFRPTRDTVLLHLGHPLFRQALSAFACARFPGSHDGGSASRWTCRRAEPGEVPAGAAARLLLTVEELAVNELREPMHHWVRTLRIPLQEDRGGARLLAPLPYQPPGRPDSAAPATELQPIIISFIPQEQALHVLRQRCIKIFGDGPLADVHAEGAASSALRGLTALLLLITRQRVERTPLPGRLTLVPRPAPRQTAAYLTCFNPSGLLTPSQLSPRAASRHRVRSCSAAVAHYEDLQKLVAALRLPSA